MTTTELKGTLLTRAANLAGELKRCRQRRILMESDLMTARGDEASVEGQLGATQQALVDLESPFEPPAPPAAVKAQETKP